MNFHSVEDLGPVLNPGLVRALLRLGRVSIGNPGQRAEIETRHEVIAGHARKVSVFSHWGEYYRIDCPYCRDGRKRLDLCHLWGTSDPVTGRPMLHLLHCHNGDCLKQRDLHASFIEGLFGYGRPPQILIPDQVSMTAGSHSPAVSPPRTIPLPEEFQSISDPACPASVVRYLESRLFDPAELAERWDVGFSAASKMPPPAFRQRLVVPIHDVARPVRCDRPPESVLVSWQARRLDDRPPKYLFATGTQKSRILYGLPQALGTLGPIVVVEGVTDVWRLGSHAVATFGKKLSALQLTLLAVFDGRPLVLFPDRDAADEAEAIQRQIRTQRDARDDTAEVVIARLPKGRNDVAECTRLEAWGAVARALEWTDRKLSRERTLRRWT